MATRRIRTNRKTKRRSRRKGRRKTKRRSRRKGRRKTKRRSRRKTKRKYKKRKYKKNNNKMYSRIIEAYGYNNFSYNKVIDLSNINNMISNVHMDKPITLYSTTDKMKYFPVYNTLKGAIKNSPSKGVHLLVPGLLPAPDGHWRIGEKHKIYYMPNDSKPHHHGDAPHHLVEWDINEVFEVKDMNWYEVEGKRIQKYRQHKDIVNFNKGHSNTAVETWIDWRIPHNQQDYPQLIVRKNSIIWWDFYNTHNLGMLRTKEEYNNNDFTNAIIVSKMNNKNSQTLVTIMNEKGTYYFVCTVPGHAQMGHKIIIKVI